MNACNECGEKVTYCLFPCEVCSELNDLCRHCREMCGVCWNTLCKTHAIHPSPTSVHVFNRFNVDDMCKSCFDRALLCPECEEVIQGDWLLQRCVDCNKVCGCPNCTFTCWGTSESRCDDALCVEHAICVDDEVFCKRCFSSEN